MMEVRVRFVFASAFNRSVLIGSGGLNENDVILCMTSMPCSPWRSTIILRPRQPKHTNAL